MAPITASQTGAMVQAQQAAALAAQSSNSLARMTQALAAMRTMQSAARAITLAVPSITPNGLQLGGLVPDSGLAAAGVANRAVTWTGAKTPTETVAAGHTTVTVRQTAAQAILNWNSFNIGRNTTLAFQQSQASWTALNQIGSASPSRIEGAITAIGQVYLINRNGIIFTGSSQVNVGALIASTAGIGASQYLTNGIYSTETNLTYSPSFTLAGGAVTVQAGASLATNGPATITSGGGFVLLLGTQVDNAGAIATPAGQTELAAGDSFIIRPGYGSDTNSSSTTRGNEIAPVLKAAGSSLTGGSGLVRNDGLITATTGDITLAGETLVQNGVLLSTTSVNVRGTIHLLSSTSDVHSSVTLTGNSVAEIEPDLTEGDTALNSQRAGLIVDSLTQDGVRTHELPLTPQFDDLNPLDDREDQSRVEITSGGLVEFQGGSHTLANGGQVAVQATRRVQVDRGAVLDVSGSVGVALPMTANQVPVSIENNELRDNPQNRLTGNLNNNTVYVETNDLSLVPASASDSSARDYTPGGLLEVSGYLNTTGHTIGEWTAIGGSIALATGAKGAVVTQTGSVFDISGGALDYQGGYLRQSYLTASNGQIYNLNDAPADLTYTGVYNGFMVDHPNWGVAQTYAGSLHTPAEVYEQGYIVGRDAGSLSLDSATSLFNGTIEDAVIDGPSQTAAAPAGVGDPYLLGQNVVAAPGTLTVAHVISGNTLQTASKITIGAGAGAATDAITTAEKIPTTLSGASLFNAAALSAAALGAIDVVDDGAIAVTSPLALAAGGAITLYGASVDVGASLTAPGGTVAIANIANVGGTVIALQSAKKTGSIILAKAATIDTAGLWNNLSLGDAAPSDAAYSNGGAVSLTSVNNLTLGAGSLIDASAGAVISLTGGRGGGVGGNITLVAGDSLTGASTGDLILNGTLRSDGFAHGGALALSAPSFVIRGKPAARPDPAVVTLTPGFFAQGFSAYDLTSFGAVTVEPGTVVDVVEPVYQFTEVANLVPSGAPVTAGASLTLNPVYLANPTATAITQRPGASFTVVTKTELAAKKPKLPAIAIGTGAAIGVDPGQTIHLESAGQLTVYGDLAAPGGKIDLWSDDEVTDAAFTHGKLVSIWLGGASIIDANAAGFTATGADGASVGIAPAGGTITIGNTDTVGSGVNSTEAAIIIRKGAVVEASGAAAVDRLATRSGLGLLDATPAVLGQPVALAGNGGSVLLSSEHGIYLNGSLAAFAGGPGAAGGTLLVALETDAAVVGTTAQEKTPRILTISQSTDAAQLPAKLAPGEQSAALVDGAGQLSVAQIAAGGFGTVALFARDAFRFKGDVNLTATQAIELYRGAIVETNPKDSVTLAAPYVLLSGQTPVSASNTTLVQAVSGYATKSAAGTFTVDADLVDVQNSLSFGGVETTVDEAGRSKHTQLTGFGDEILNSTGDLRFLSATAVSGGTTPPTTLITTANLDLVAREIYAIGDAVVLVGFDPTATGKNGTFNPKKVLTIGRAPGTTPAAPLNLGGSLTLIAATIQQGGVIWQPMGGIDFGQIGAFIGDSLPGHGDPRGVVDFQSGSLTSVSAAGLTIPYGGTTDSVTYTVNGLAVSAATGTVGFGLGSVTGGIGPGTITVQALQTRVEAGATLDLTGGGVLSGAGFISGEGGSTDLTTTPFLSVSASGVVTQPTLATDPVYAIVAGAQPGQAPEQIFTQTGATGSTPALGEEITIPVGIPGLPAGRYTLLPAAYALTPGGYRVELDGAANLAAPAVAALANGSYAISGGTDIANTGVHSTAPLAITVTPAAALRQDADYDEQNYSQFLIAQAARIGAVRPVLPIDAGTLVLNFPGTSTASIVNQGAASFAPAAGGVGGTLVVSGALFGTTPNFDIYGDTADFRHGPKTVLLSADALDAFDAFILEIGAAGAGINAEATGITLEPSATLTGARVILTALTSGITLKPGSAIDTLGQGSLPFDSTTRGDYSDGGASVLDVGNGYLAYASSNAGGAAYGPISIDDGATIYTDGSIAFATQAAVNIGVNAIYGGRYLDLALPEINIGDPASLGASAAAGLTLTQQVLQRLTGGAPGIGLPAVQILVLAASDSLNFFGTTGIDLSGGNVQLVLDTPAIYGYGGAGDVSRISAGTIVWNGQLTTNTSTGLVGAGQPGGVLSNGPGTGTGTLDLVANTIVFGYSDLDKQSRDVPLSRLTLGFSTVNLDAATEITANNQGTLAVYQAQATYGAPGAGGTLNLNTPLLTTENEATIGFTAGGALNVNAVAGAAAGTASQAAGGEIDLSGGAVDIDSAVILPSGKLNVQAAGNIAFGAASQVDLAGEVTTIFDRSVYGFGGDLIAESAAGDITQSAGATIDVAAINNTAGSIQLTARNPAAGAVALNGALLGGATGGYASGVFQARAQSLGDFAALNAALNAGGFFQSRSFDIVRGDLTVGTGVIAHQVAISVDAGSLTVTGLIDASGGGGGNIDLAAQRLIVAGTADLAANGTVLVVDSYGQPIPAANAPTISLTASTGTLTLAPGARLDLASADGVARGDLELNVPRLGSATYGDAAIEAAGPVNIAGAATIAVNAFWTYHGLPDPNLTASGAPDALITQAYLDQIDATDSQPFMAAAATNADLAGRLAGLTSGYAGILHLRPGVAIVSATPEGDLTVQGDLDLAGYRYNDPAGYGARVNGAVYGSGEPGVLTIRAGGDLNVYGSITDGFAKPINDAGTEFAQGWVLYAGLEPYGQNIVLPVAVTVAKGTQFSVGETVNFAVPITGGTFQSGAATPVALTLSGSRKVPVPFVATSAITDRAGRVLYAQGQVVPAGAVLPAGAVIGAGGALPFAVSVGPVVWPANHPFLVTQGGGFDVVISGRLTLQAGSIIPGGSFIMFYKGEPGVTQPSPNGKRLFFANSGDPVPATYGTRPVGTDGGQGQLYPLAQLLPTGDLSWSINLVSGADTTAADPTMVQTASGLAAAGAKGDLTLADAHYGTIVQLIKTPPLHNPNNPKNHKICARDPASCEPTYQASGEVVVPAFSVVRTGTGTLTLAAGGSVTEASDYGVYTAGAQSAPILNSAGGNPYDLAQGLDVPNGTLLGTKNASLTALVANYQANYPVGGGNLTVTAQGNLNGFISTAFQPVNPDQTTINLTDTDAIGSWLWRQGGAGVAGAWWEEFGGLTIPPGEITSANLSQDTVFAEMVGFQGIGTLGGGNVTVNVGGDASALNLAVGATGRVLDNGTLVQDGGGALNVKIGGALNFISPQFTGIYSASAAGDAGGLLADLRGNTTLAVGSVGIITQDYNLTVEPNDPRTLQPLLTDIYLITEGIDLAPGDGTVAINSRGDLVVDGVANPGTVQNLVNETPAFLTKKGVTTATTHGGASSFSLWSPATGISLFSAGGDVTPFEGFGPATNAGDFYTPILSVTAQSGNIDFAPNQASMLELAPSAEGQLTLLAAGSILGAAADQDTTVAISGASPSLEATPFNPSIIINSYEGLELFTNDSPEAASNLIAFGADTPTSAIHAGGQPALVYAGAGDIIDLQFGAVEPQAAGSQPATWYLAAEPFDVQAGRDIVASGSLASPSLFLNLSPTDITTFEAGRDILESSLDIAGPGTLMVQAGRNLYQADQGTIYSIGPIFNIDPNNRDSGAAISVLAGVGAAGPDYSGFERHYLDPASGLDLEDAAAIIAGNDAILTAWLQANYGYDGTAAGAYDYFVALNPAAQAVFLRQLYFDELNASGLEYTDSSGVRYHSYRRGQDAIASLFPGADAAGQPITYAGNITLFGNSGIHTDFGGAIQTFTPGGETLIGVEGATPPGSAGFITQGSGDIDIYAQNSVELGESRVLTTFGGGIVIWSATGNIDAGRGAKTTVVYTPVQRVYDAYGNVVLSPNVPSTGAGIATLNPIPQVAAGNIDLVAPFGTVNAGEAGIRVSGNLNIAALHVANAANITVQGTTTGVPHAPAVNTGALATAGNAAGAATLAAENAGRTAPQSSQPSIWIVEVLGYGGGANTPPPVKKRKDVKDIQASNNVVGSKAVLF